MTLIDVEEIDVRQKLRHNLLGPTLKIRLYVYGPFSKRKRNIVWKVLLPLDYTRSEGDRMATQSFYEDLVLDSPEAVCNLEKAIDEADRRGPLRIRDTGAMPCTDDVIRKFMES